MPPELNKWNDLIWDTAWTTTTTDKYTATSTLTIPWQTWTNTTTATTLQTTSATVWPVWTTTAAPTRVTYRPAVRPEDLAVQAEVTAQMAAYKAECEAAAARARELLDELLDEEQRQELITHARFHVRSQHGNRYRLLPYVVGNVEWVDEQDAVKGRFCAHPSGVPVHDVLAAQKLMLETDEASFLRIANVHAGTRPPLRAVA